jgi:hypothetical protein
MSRCSTESSSFRLQQRSYEVRQFAALEQISAYARCGCRLEVMLLVRDQNAGLSPHLPALKTVEDHSRRRLAQIACAAPLFDHAVPVIGAILKLIDVGTSLASRRNLPHHLSFN